MVLPSRAQAGWGREERVDCVTNRRGEVLPRGEELYFPEERGEGVFLRG